MATDIVLLKDTKDFLSSDRNKSTEQQPLDFQGKQIKVGWCYFIRRVVDGEFKQDRIIGNILSYMKNNNLKYEECMLIPQSWFERKK